MHIHHMAQLGPDSRHTPLIAISRRDAGLHHECGGIRHQDRLENVASAAPDTVYANEAGLKVVFGGEWDGGVPVSECHSVGGQEGFVDGRVAVSWVDLRVHRVGAVADGYDGVGGV